MENWEETAQQWGTLLVDRWSAAEFQQPFELSRLKLQALGDAGYYTEGQRGTASKPAALPAWVLPVAAVAAVVLLARG